MGHCDMEMVETKNHPYGSTNEPNGKKHCEHEYKISNNNNKKLMQK